MAGLSAIGYASGEPGGRTSVRAFLGMLHHDTYSVDISTFQQRSHTPCIPHHPSKDVWMQHGWRERPVPQEQLYDLIFDPNEACNIADDPSAADVLADMRSRLAKWMRATDDPLLDGPVPAPSGARIGDPDGVSPIDEGLYTVTP